jgi:hypothetical protein
MWMLLMPELHRMPQAAVVSRGDAGPDMPRRYLQLTEAAAPRWTDDLQAATAFESMREATRAATRLPAALRAFGLPRRAEVFGNQDLH